MGSVGALTYTVVLSEPDKRVGEFLPSALPQYRSNPGRDTRCFLCDHSSDNLGPLVNYQDTR